MDELEQMYVAFLFACAEGGVDVSEYTFDDYAFDIALHGRMEAGAP